MSYADPPGDVYGDPDSMLPEGAPASMQQYAAAGGKKAAAQNNPLTPVTVKQVSQHTSELASELKGGEEEEGGGEEDGTGSEASCS